MIKQILYVYDLYIKKIRQLESTNNDLTVKYESALEDLITNQTEFSNYKEKSEDSKKIKREREEIGIALYSLQQQFATVESAFNEKYSQCRALDEQVKQLGVDDNIVGLWAGAMLALLGYWLILWFNKKKWFFNHMRILTN